MGSGVLKHNTKQQNMQKEGRRQEEGDSKPFSQKMSWIIIVVILVTV